MRRYFGERVYTTVIPRNVRLSEAPSYGMAAVEYDPACAGAKAYKKFADEFLKRHAKRDSGRSGVVSGDQAQAKQSAPVHVSGVTSAEPT